MSLPLTIAIVNPKGGTGKTTIAVNLAVAAHRDGHPNTILDTDPQGSVLDWHERTPDDYNGPHVDRLGEHRTLAAAIGQIDTAMAVVDSPAGLDERTDRVLSTADLALVPVRPSGLDLWGTDKFLDLLTDHVEDGLTAALVTSQTDARTRLSDRLTDVLSEKDFPILYGFASRVAFARSMYEGQTVLDGYDEKAASEVWALLQDVKNLMS